MANRGEQFVCTECGQQEFVADQHSAPACAPYVRVIWREPAEFCSFECLATWAAKRKGNQR